jgi:hypothetical protein
MEGTLIVTTQRGGPIDYFSLALGSGLEGYEVIRAMGLSMTHESYTEINLGKRTVYQASGHLQYTQKMLVDKWVKPLPIGDSIAYEGFNIREKLEPLTSHEVLITTDIVRFFDNIGYRQVKAVMDNHYEQAAAKILASIFTMTAKSGRRFLPQGGVASPFVANRVAALVIDPVIRACLPPGATYMRYCDNLLIGCSEEDCPGALIAGLRSVISSTGFRLHKTSVKRKHQRQKALGLVLNEVVNVPRKYVDAVRATLNNVVASSWEEQAGTTPVELFKARTLGKARYVMDNSTTARSGRVRKLYETLS